MELGVIAFGLAAALLAARSHWATNHVAHFVERLLRF